MRLTLSILTLIALIWIDFLMGYKLPWSGCHPDMPNGWWEIPLVLTMGAMNIASLVWVFLEVSEI